MKITIDVPEMKCTRCDAVAPIQPHLLYFKSQVPEQMREAFSAVLKERPDVSATDSAGRAWGVMADEKPLGWVKGPHTSDLCAKCGAAWFEASKAFLAPTSAVVPKPMVTAVAKMKMTPAMAKTAMATRPPLKGAVQEKKPARMLSATDPGFNYGAKKKTLPSSPIAAPKVGSGVSASPAAVPARSQVPPVVTGLQ